MLSVKYGDYELSEYIGVLDDFIPNVGASFESKTEDMGAVNGVRHHYTVYREKKIQMPFDIVGDVNKKYDALCDALRAEAPKKLVFGNLPDRFFWALPSGGIKAKRISKDIMQGEVTWLIPDGVAHGIEPISFPFQASGTEIRAEIWNNGTAPAPLNVEFEHVGENGYIGIASPFNVAEFGDVSEEDEEAKTRSVVVLNKAKNELTAGTTSADTWHAINKVTGTTKLDSSNRPVLNIKPSACTAKVWNGQAYRFALSEPCEKLKAEFKFVFSTDTFEQMGFLELTFTDESHGAMTGILIKKTGTSNTARVYFRVNGETVQYYDMVVMNLNKSTKSTTFDGKTLTVVIAPKYAKFTLPTGAVETFYDDSLAEHRFKYANLALGVYSNTAKSIARVVLTSLKVKHVYTEIIDIPNRFDDGSVVRIDGEQGKFFVDEMESPEDEVAGSTYLQIPPRQTVPVVINLSSWANKPKNININLREVYL